MRDTSHSPIVPCGPLEQSPFGDNFRHALTALLSSGLDSGENAGVGWGGGETLGLSSKFGMATTKARAVLYAKLYVFTLCKARVWVCVFAHAPPLQEFCEMMLTRSSRNMDPKSRRQTNLYMLVYRYSIALPLLYR